MSPRSCFTETMWPGNSSSTALCPRIVVFRPPRPDCHTPRCRGEPVPPQLPQALHVTTSATLLVRLPLLVLTLHPDPQRFNFPQDEVVTSLSFHRHRHPCCCCCYPPLPLLLCFIPHTIALLHHSYNHHYHRLSTLRCDQTPDTILHEREMTVIIITDIHHHRYSSHLRTYRILSLSLSALATDIQDAATVATTLPTLHGIAFPSTHPHS